MSDLWFLLALFFLFSWKFCLETKTSSNFCQHCVFELPLHLCLKLLFIEDKILKANDIVEPSQMYKKMKASVREQKDSVSFFLGEVHIGGIFLIEEDIHTKNEL